jgi:tRNA-binding protein
MTTPLEAFAILDMRSGTVHSAVPFPEARKPALKLEIDFGPVLGVKRSSAQITLHYEPQQLVGRQVVAAVNLGERRIAGFVSQVLVLGGLPADGDVILLAPDMPVPNGTRVA